MNRVLINNISVFFLHFQLPIKVKLHSVSMFLDITSLFCHCFNFNHSNLLKSLKTVIRCILDIKMMDSGTPALVWLHFLAFKL